MARWLTDRVAVVTGAGRGIGREIALLFAAQGASVVVNDYGVTVDGRSPSSEPAQGVVDEIRQNGGRAVASLESVADYRSAERIVRTALDNFGALHILVNCAGILRDRMVFNMTEEEWDVVIGVHLKGTFNCTRFASTVMRQQRYGRIINFSSDSGLVGRSGQANYGAAKAGIAGFTRVTARDLGRYGITVNAVLPGAATRMTATTPQSTYEIRAAMGIDSGLSRRKGTYGPEFVAPLVAFLASEAATSINGQFFGIKGGTVALWSQPHPIKTLYKEGLWTVDELVSLIPDTLATELEDSAPPQPLS